MRQVDMTRFDQVVSYIQNSNNYTLERYMRDKGLLKNMKQQGVNYFISCPYHSDSSPSMSVNFDRGIYSCFGCGVGGSYLKFVSEYESFIGSKTDVFKVSNKLLKEDILMQNTLGFTTIYRDVRPAIDITNIEFRKRNKLNKDIKPTFISIAKQMKSEDVTLDDKLLMISLMQSGMEPSEVLSSMYNKPQGNLNYNDLSISDLLGGVL